MLGDALHLQLVQSVSKLVKSVNKLVQIGQIRIHTCPSWSTLVQSGTELVQAGPVMDSHWIVCLDGVDDA